MPGQRRFKTCSASFNQQSGKLCRAIFFLLTVKDGNTKDMGLKEGNGSFCTLGVRKLVWKSTNPGLQTYFYLKAYLSLYFFFILPNNTSILSQSVLP